MTPDRPVDRRLPPDELRLIAVRAMLKAGSPGHYRTSKPHSSCRSSTSCARASSTRRRARISTNFGVCASRSRDARAAPRQGNRQGGRYRRRDGLFETAEAARLDRGSPPHRDVCTQPLKLPPSAHHHRRAGAATRASRASFEGSAAAAGLSTARERARRAAGVG